MATKQRRIAGALGWGLAGNIVLRVSNLAVTLVVARIIAPDVYGAFAVGLTVWAVAGTLAEGGFGTDLIRAKDPERLLPTVSTLGLLVGLLIAGLVVALAPWIAGLFHAPDAVDVVRVMGAGLCLVGLSLVPAALLNREFRQATLLVVNLAGVAVMAASTLGLAAAGWGAMALAWGQVAGQSATLVALYVAVGRLPRFGWDRVQVIASVRFGAPLALANLVSWLLLTVDNLIVSRALLGTGLGLYVMAFNVSSWPMSAVGQAIRVVALPAFAHVEDVAGRARGFLRALGPVCAIAALMGVGLACLAGPLFIVLFDPKWEPAAQALVGLAVFGGLRVVLDLLATFVIAAGHTRDVLLVQVVWMAAMVAVMTVSVQHFGLLGAGWAHVLVAVLVVQPAYVLALRRAGVAPLELVRVLPRPLLFVLPAVLAALLVIRVLPGALLQLIAGSVAILGVFLIFTARWGWRAVQALRAGSGELSGLSTASEPATGGAAL